MAFMEMKIKTDLRGDMKNRLYISKFASPFPFISQKWVLTVLPVPLLHPQSPAKCASSFLEIRVLTWTLPFWHHTVPIPDFPSTSLKLYDLHIHFPFPYLQPVTIALQLYSCAHVHHATIPD